MNTRPIKRRRVSPSRSGDDHGDVRNNKKSKSNGKGKSIATSFLQSAANWNLEADYQKRSKKQKKASDKLPIRTTGGVIEQSAPYSKEDSDEEDEEGGAEGRDGEGDGEGEEGDAKTDQTDKNARPRLSEAEELLYVQEEAAKLAAKLNENPEEHPGAFKALGRLARKARFVSVQKLCLLAQLAVYKDMIPGYQIRTFGDDLSKQRLTAEVRRLRAYESALALGYQAYLKELTRIAKLDPRLGADSTGRNGLADIALTCACTLVESVPHFNFREDLLRILVFKLSKRRQRSQREDLFDKCLATLASLFHDDEEGRPSMEAVALLSKMMRARDYRVDESVLNSFLHLRLLSEFAGKASQEAVDRLEPKQKPKVQRQFRTKRERKEIKEQKSLDRDMEQADALVAHEERERMQSETLKLVFATYFRILKLRVPHLMGAVLEGLAKYAHLINQDFFGDLLEALKDLIRHSEEDRKKEQEGKEGEENEENEEEDDDDDDDDVPRNPSREALLCTVTAYALLAGQDAHKAKGDLHLDLSFFTTNLFRSLFPLALEPDLERHAKSLTLLRSSSSSSSSSSAKINLQTTTVLLIRCLTAVLLPAYQVRSVPPLRLAAFSKLLMGTSLHVPEKSAQALLALLQDVADAHGPKIAALWHTEERRGDGTFQPLSESLEGSNPFAATVWEGELLRHHYCPKVREGVKALEKYFM